MMRDVDPSIELIACGSCSVHLPTYMEWDRRVLEYVGDLADYVSLHRYVGNRDDDTPDFLAVTSAIDRQIEEMDAVCRYVQAKRRSPRRAYLCFDEWNVWYRNRGGDGEGQFAPHLLEEVYNLEDALVVAGFLNSFVRHANVVKIANLAQVVNVIAPIMTRDDELLVQSIYYPFEMFSRRGRGMSLALCVDGPHFETKTHGNVPCIDASAIQNDGLLSVFAVNRSLDDTAMVRIRLADADMASLQDASVLTAMSPKSANSFEQPDSVAPRPLTEFKIAQGDATVELPPLSVTAMTFKVV
jgi:alpha-N-arabinofuranosidase